MRQLCARARRRTIGDNPDPFPDPSGTPWCDHRRITTAATDADREPRPYRRLYRRADDKLVAGVAAGLAEHLRIEPLVVRIAFAVLAALGGVGILLYAAFWAVVPMAPSAGTPASDRRGHRRSEQLPAIVAVAAGGMVVAGISGVVFDSAVAWSLVLVAVGVGFIWHQADEAQRRRWPAHAGDKAIARLALGAVLVVAGVTLILGPWWLRLVNDLTEERRERIRSEERADLAAHVHDSVLQTLTLVQRHADDPGEVRRLARIQERELRGWLYAAPRTTTAQTVAGALEAAAAEVEDLHRIRVEVVAVGDAPLDDRVGALVLAAREAMVNAAKFSGRPQVDVYAEVEPAAVTVFVRDTGAGFDPATVPGDRRGIAESIVGRLARAGGRATVRSAPGRGTEVELTVPR